MHDQQARLSQASRKRVKAKAQEASQTGPMILWAGGVLILTAFMVLQSF